MSAQTPQPPAMAAATASRPIDENRLPGGQCRYILLNPEIKGQRCACVGFTLNHALPGVFCECGHLSCYHIKSAKPPLDQSEVDELRRRIQVLEGQLDRENQMGIGSALGNLVKRLADMEEQIENNKEETSQEMKDCYRNVSRVWQSVDQVGKRQAAYENRAILYDERLDGHDDTLHRLGDRLIEVDEASMALEERVEALEDLDMSDVPVGRQRRRSTSESEQSKRGMQMITRRHRPSGHGEAGTAQAASARTQDSHQHTAAKGPSESSFATGPWTVHVSLLPTTSQPFPFEKDTNAYKRCLSRGLHQMIAVRGADSESFANAVTKAFGSLLRGREWVPLQARLCDVATLQGLPMLRPLDPALVGVKYDHEFLQKHCAVCCPNGKIESLYIAMLSDTFSWHFLRRSPCHLEGLEESWAYDPLLDPNEESMRETGGEEDQPSAGDIMPLPNLKRTASEMSRAPSFSTASTGDGSEGSRPKLQRTACIQTPMELGRRGMETV